MKIRHSGAKTPLMDTTEREIEEEKEIFAFERKKVRYPWAHSSVSNKNRCFGLEFLFIYLILYVCMYVYCCHRLAKNIKRRTKFSRAF